MTQPKASPETMARLCEAVSVHVRIVHEASTVDQDARIRQWDKCRALVDQYRAETTPPLRSRAEVDAEIADNVRSSVTNARGMACDDCLCPEGDSDNSRAERIRALCAEPTAPEPAPSAEQPPRDELLRRLARIAEISKAAYGVSAQQELLNIFALAFEVRETELEPNPLTNHDQDTREERPCGCEEAEALKDQVTELRRLLGHVHGTVAGLAKLLETLP
jgi:hypothetical protein